MLALTHWRDKYASATTGKSAADGLGDPLDRGQCRRDARVRGPGAVLDLRVGVGAVLLVEHGQTLRPEVPRLRQPGASVDRLERESPAHIAGTDEPREFHTRFGPDHLTARLPGASRYLVVPGEMRADPRPVAVVPPAPGADRAPLPHAGHIG